MCRHEQKFKQLGLNVAYYRKLRNMSQSELAYRTNISRTHISRIEAPNMEKSFSISTIFDIAEVLGIDVKEFFDFFEQPQNVALPEKVGEGTYR